MRNALAQLAEDISARIGPFGYRVCVDSAPVLEKALARNAGLGWIGKHTNLIARDAGSYFFLGEILTDLPLPLDAPASAHCGTCAACIPACPTQAIVAPYRLDARRCISYLTIEHKGSIPVELRRPIGNRIYGCDDCQLVCPWNKFARAASHPDFKVRHGLDAAAPHRTVRVDAKRSSTSACAGSAIHRIGYERWSAQYRRGAGQRAAIAAKSIAALDRAARGCFTAGARARGVGAGAQARAEGPAAVSCDRLSMRRALPGARRREHDQVRATRSRCGARERLRVAHEK